jgi:hypothetical protein
MPIRRLVILAGPAIVVASLILLAGPTATAAAHTCGSNWCSGTDGGQNGVSSKNIQGSGPQIYNGEVGVYYLDVAGGSGGKPCPTDGFATGACFTARAASLDSHVRSVG